LFVHPNASVAGIGTHGPNNSDSDANNADTIKIPNNSNKGNSESKLSNSTSKEMK
jgi:hypothetical protein